MKVAIFGKNSYIGKSFCSRTSSVFNIDSKYINSRNEEWKNISFLDFDVILHVAGIAHVSTDPNMGSLYYSVNRDLPIAVAIKAKAEGVKQFIFMSSIIVFGRKTNITADTKPEPTNFYGKSKLQAEEGLLALADDTFNVTIIRTPMVYGPNCKGNFPALIKLAHQTIVFPDFKNKRSMIYIDNLCVFIELCMENQISGIVYPQNTEYVSTKDIIAQAAVCMCKKIYFTKVFNPLINILSREIQVVNKVFGTKIYDASLSPNREQYNIYTFEESIRRYCELTRKE
jgi:nucleoside-diphosphate-sugar epimerase